MSKAKVNITFSNGNSVQIVVPESDVENILKYAIVQHTEKEIHFTVDNLRHLFEEDNKVKKILSTGEKRNGGIETLDENINRTHEDYINHIKKLIKDDYLSEENLAPIKCTNCESEDLKDNNFSYENHILIGYERECKNCGESAGQWTYGAWETI